MSNSPFIENALVLKTDGNGQISGSGWLWVDYSNAPYSAFLVDATGKKMDSIDFEVRGVRAPRLAALLPR